MSRPYLTFDSGHLSSTSVDLSAPLYSALSICYSHDSLPDNITLLRVNFPPHFPRLVLSLFGQP